MANLATAVCIGSPSCVWETESIASDGGGLISLLIEPLTGYARILTHTDDRIEFEKCTKRGFLIAETLGYGGVISISECKSALKQLLKEKRADIAWIEAVANLPPNDVPDIVAIPGRENDPEHTHRPLKTTVIHHRYLCATINGD